MKRKYEIKSINDIKHIMKHWSETCFLRVIQTEEIMTLPELLYLYDGQKINIEITK